MQNVANLANRHFIGAICLFCASCTMTEDVSHYYHAAPLPTGGAVAPRVTSLQGQSYAFTGVIRQEYDFSCGAASLAMLLNRLGDKTYTEKYILDAIGKQEALSFQDLIEYAQKEGFNAGSYHMPFDRLLNLTVPAIVWLDFPIIDHFVLAIGGNEQEQLLVADPSVGNTYYTRGGFLKKWEVVEESGLDKGRVLVVW